MSESSIEPVFITNATVTLVRIDFSIVPWYLRAWTVLRLPLDIARFILSGKVSIGGPFKVPQR